MQQAALVYFDHGAKELTIAEAALLAGIPADPSRYDPVANPERAKARRRTVLRAMLEESKITPRAVRRGERDRRCPSRTTCGCGAPRAHGALHFVNYVKQQLIDEYGSAEVFGGGLKVRTTIDLELQEAARDAISKWLTNPDGPSAALVAIDPRDGAVKAMVGGNNYRKSQFNLAVQGVRQPGSAFKPFVLATALRQGISPATHFESKPQAINLGDKYWVVGNYDDDYLGSIDLETGDGRVGQRRLRAADPARRLEERRRDRQAPRDPEQARRLLRDRARRRGRDAARARACVRDPRARRPPRRRQRSPRTGRA